MSSSSTSRHGGRSSWSWRIGSIAGIDIRIHVTLAALFAWIVFVHLSAGQRTAELARALALIGSLFGFVLLHELGHALTARRFGVTTRDITLLPIGGVSALERMPERPSRELLVALAGPLVNLALAAVLGGLLLLLRLPPWPDRLLAAGGPLLAQLLWINFSLAVFNLLPAFPSDGGRALRAILAMRLPPARATAIAATVGRTMAIAFVVLGLLVDPLLVVIGIFLYAGASAEASWARLAAQVAGLRAEDAMNRGHAVVGPEDSLARAAALIVAGGGEIAVEKAGQVIGVVSRDRLARGVRRLGPDASVEAIMDTDLEAVDAATPLARAVERARTGVTLVVERDGRALGLLTPDDVANLLLLAPALRAG